MQCFNPISITLSDETRAKRIAAEYMPLEWRFATKVNVPCGKCAACLSRRRSQWTFRLMEELKNSESCYFLTLTYDDEHLPWEFVNIDGECVPVSMVCKRDVQLFLKRLRKSIEPFKIRYFMVSEYGPKTFRPHYHMILFNFPPLLKNKLDEYLTNAWDLGFIRVDPISDARINYVTSYCLDSSTLPPYLVKNFMLCSRRPAVGSSYIDNVNIVRHHIDQLNDMCVVSDHGKPSKIKMPRYYCDKIFSDHERNEINNKNSEYHDTQRAKFNSRQRRWLIKHGYEPTESNMKTAYDGSPLDLEIQKRDEFTRKVERKCKMKKNG